MVRPESFKQDKKVRAVELKSKTMEQERKRRIRVKLLRTGKRQWNIYSWQKQM